MIALGIDPDTKATGYAFVERTPRGNVGVTDVGVIRAAGKLAEDRREPMALAMASTLGAMRHDILAIEWQKLRPYVEKNPNSMMAVQAVAGMALGICAPTTRSCGGRVLLPIPREWKGSIPKEVHQARILKRLSVPSSGLDKILPSLRTHAIDAIGLALWALDQP